MEAVIARVRQELRAFLLQRDDITRKVGTVKRTLVSLVTMFGYGLPDSELLRLMGYESSPERPHLTKVDEEILGLLGYKGTERRPGLTKECRAVLMSAETPLTTRQVCEQVQQRLPAVRNHKDPLASVTTVLNRLLEYGEASILTGENGQHRWLWTTEAVREGPQPGNQIVHYPA